MGCYKIILDCNDGNIVSFKKNSKKKKNIYI